MLVATVLRASAQAGEPPAVSDIADRIVCTCGCSNMVLRSCQCGTAAAMREQILTKIEAGETAEAILANYVDQYGETILAAPTKEGFNLTAYWLAYVLIALFAVFIIFVLRRWTAHDKAPDLLPLGAEAAFEDAEYLARLEDELKGT